MMAMVMDVVDLLFVNDFSRLFTRCGRVELTDDLRRRTDDFYTRTERGHVGSLLQDAELSFPICVSQSLCGLLSFASEKGSAGPAGRERWPRTRVNGTTKNRAAVESGRGLEVANA